MAFSELIKNFEPIRAYMKEFYIYGFKTRDEYDKKSGRSYDNERRRIESYLGGYMGFRQTPDGKNVFLSIDSRSSQSNPLYKAFKAKSFTNGDITLHFIIFDILYSPEIHLSLREIMQKIDGEYLAAFHCETLYDESTVRKKLKEYTGLGLITSEKQGKQMLYGKTADTDISSLTDAVEFFSEVGACGVIGSFLLDKTALKQNPFSFKHHYISGTLDSEILCTLLCAVYEKKTVELNYESHRKKNEEKFTAVPLKIYVSTQSGRQYLFAYLPRYKKPRSFRLDYINRVTAGEAAENYEEAAALFENAKKHLWGVSLGHYGKTEHVEFTVHIENSEEYIYQRLLREKRVGEVTRPDKNTCIFSADVYDTSEMIPWIRTFICRITALNFSNRTVENQFKQDIEEMYRLYEDGGDEQ